MSRDEPIIIVDLSDDEDNHQDIDSVDNVDDNQQSPDSDEDEDINSIDNDDGNYQQGGIYGHWWFCDERLILRTLAAGRHRTGKVMSTRDLYEAVHPQLRRQDATMKDLSQKVSGLKTKFQKAADGGPRDNDRDRRLYELSMQVWPGEEALVEVVVID